MRFAYEIGPVVSPRPYGSRRDVKDIDAVVLHTSESHESWDDVRLAEFMLREVNRASWHVCTSPRGATWVVPDSWRCWHAGNSAWNTRSVGVEMTTRAADWGKNPDEDTLLLAATADVVAVWCRRYLLPTSIVSGADMHTAPVAPGIVRHSQVTPHNRVDPGRLFPAARFQSMVDKRVAKVPLAIGDSSTWVRDVQAELGITADGVFGPATDDKVRERQAAAGMPVTGVTWLGRFLTEEPPTVVVPEREPVVASCVDEDGFLIAGEYRLRSWRGWSIETAGGQDVLTVN